jgi:hypothetical protein
MAASLSFNPSSSFLPACPVDGMEWRETNDTPTPYPGTIDSGRFGSGRMSWRDGDVLRVLLPRWLALQCTEYSTVLGRRHKAPAFPCSPKQASVVSFSVHCSAECDEQEGASLLPPCSFGLFGLHDMSPHDVPPARAITVELCLGRSAQHLGHSGLLRKESTF